jgi:hypothetical protein
MRREQFGAWGGGYAAEPGTGPEGLKCADCFNYLQNWSDSPNHDWRDDRCGLVYLEERNRKILAPLIDAESPACAKFGELPECC